MEIDSILRECIEKAASDLLIIADSPLMIRRGGKLSLLNEKPLSAEESKKLIYSLLTEDQQTRFEKEKELDSSYHLQGVSRFRVNAHYQRGSVAASLRTIPEQIPSLESLRLPAAATDFIKEPRGLVLVTGATGSGKSTTQAAMIDVINHSRSCHIITIEDPIEFIHNNDRSVIEQREVGFDTDSFTNALNRVLRQNPDVILIGEMRELDTISTAVTAAETGHLVISTLHTNDAVQTIDRIVDVFPPHQQNQIRIQLSMTLQGVICQQLIPRSDGMGLVVAAEVLKVNPAVRNIIRKGSTQEIYSMMEIGVKQGMQTMDMALRDLYRDGLIKYEDAIAKAINQDNLEKMLAKQ